MVHGGLAAATTFDLYQQHKSLGFVVLALTAARLLSRALVTAPAAAPSALWEQRLAALVQTLLYLLTAAAILAGWLLVSASPLPIPTRFFDLFVIPNIAPPDVALFAGAKLAHVLIGLCDRGSRGAARRRRAETSSHRSRRRVWPACCRAGRHGATPSPNLGRDPPTPGRPGSSGRRACLAGAYQSSFSRKLTTVPMMTIDGPRSSAARAFAASVPSVPTTTRWLSRVALSTIAAG